MDSWARLAFWRARKKPALRQAAQQESAAGSLFCGTNRLAHLEHQRDLFLAANGGDLRGEDRLTLSPGTKPPAFSLRFHLHPSVKATVSMDGTAISLMLPNKIGWRFSARGAAMALEDSVYLVGQPEPRRTVQIVLRGTAGGADKVHWAFKRLERRSNRGAGGKAAPELPF